MIIGPYFSARSSWPLARTVKVCSAPYIVPVGSDTLEFWIALATSSTPIACADSLRGSRSTRTAYLAAPKTCTCATPLTIEIRWAMVDSAYSLITGSGSVAERSTRKSTGWSPGFTFWYDGGADVPAQLELQRDIGAALRAGRVDRGDAGDGGELLFERQRHRRGQRFRARARQAGVDLDGGEVDRRQIADRQLLVRHQAEDDDAEHDQRRRDRALDEESGNVHRVVSPPGPDLTL